VNRTERLLAIVEELRAAQPRQVPAAALARRFEVSLRTVQRDLDALLRSGLPVWVQRGRRGGYALLPTRADDNSLSLSTQEALAIVVALNRLGDSVFAASGRTALRKINGLLQPEQHEQVRELTSRVRVAQPDAATPPTVRRAVEQAIAARSVLVIDYVDLNDGATRRRVEAQGVLSTPSGDYLIGWCQLRQDRRMFRLNRIRRAFVTAERAPDRDVDQLLGAGATSAAEPALEEPIVAGQSPDGAVAAPKEWVLAEIDRVVAGIVAVPDEPAEQMRAVLAHLAEWTRWHVGQVRAVVEQAPARYDGHPPEYPVGLDSARDGPHREQLIQQAALDRSPGAVRDDLLAVLHAARTWCAGLRARRWRTPIDEITRPGSRRPLAHCLAGWWSPVNHITWHLSRLDEPGHVAWQGLWVVGQCPVH